MSILDEIAKGGTARPIAAFLVGRENKRQRERQDNRDAQLDTRFNQQSELTGLRIDQIKGEPERIRAQQQQIEAGIRSKVADSELADLAVDMAFTGDMKGAFEVVRDSLNPELEKLTFQRGDENVSQLVNKRTKEVVRELGSGPRRQQIEQGEPGTFGTPSQRGAQQVKLEERVSSVNTFGAMADRTLNLMDSSPGANTVVAKLANVGNRVLQEVATVTNNLGIEFELGREAALNAENYNDTFKAAGIAGDNPRIKNGFLALAIQKAMASGLGAGRALSDFDIKQQLLTLGANQSDPDIVRLVFSDSFKGLEEGVNFMHQATPGLQMPAISRPSFVISEDAGTEADPELEALPTEEQAELLRLREKYKGKPGG